MANSSDYTRTLTRNQIKDLQEKYEPVLKRSRGGFLEIPVKEKLLHITNWEKTVTSREVSQYFYEIREHAKTALNDLGLLCDVLNEEQLQLIFGKNSLPSSSKSEYPISNVLSTLIPERLQINDLEKRLWALDEEIQFREKRIQNDQVNKDNWDTEIKMLEEQKKILLKMKKELETAKNTLESQQWRKTILEDITIRCLTWYFNSGIFQTDSHKRIMSDVVDIISIMSSGKKPHTRLDEPIGSSFEQ